MKKDASDSLPRPFGPYQLLRRLAVGGMAEVYVAKAEGLGGFEKLVALKVIHPRISEDEHFVQMLVDEAKLSVLLHHANIAQTFDLGFAEGRYFIVMEYVEGLDVYRLARRMAQRSQPMPIEACVYLVVETLAGLEYAHTKSDASGRPLRIVHRDVSPQNILVSAAGEVKLTDFGIAKAALRTIDTEVGIIKGKYDYMSPEHAWGDPVDRRSDVFSAGVVLHELLTGRSLYQEESVPALLDKVRRARIPRPSRLRAEVPAELDAVVLRALARRTEDRFQSAGAFADALARVLYGLDPGYGGPKLARLLDELGEEASRPESTHPPARRHRTTLPTMRRQDFVPAESSIVHEVPPSSPPGAPGPKTQPEAARRGPPPPPPAPMRPPVPRAEPEEDADETGIFEGPLPDMSFPTPPPPRSDEAALLVASASAALRAPRSPMAMPVPDDDDETSVFEREKSLLALGFAPEPPPPPRSAPSGDDAPTPPRGSRVPASALRARRVAETPPSIEIDPAFAREAEAVSRRRGGGVEPNDGDRTVVDTSGATARELGSMLAGSASVAAPPSEERRSSPSPLPPDFERWEPPRRSWDALPFFGPPLPEGGLVALPFDPDALDAAGGVSRPGRPRRSTARTVAGVMVLAAVAAGLAVALAN